MLAGLDFVLLAIVIAIVGFVFEKVGLFYKNSVDFSDIQYEYSETYMKYEKFHSYKKISIFLFLLVMACALIKSLQNF